MIEELWFLVPNANRNYIVSSVSSSGTCTCQKKKLQRNAHFAVEIAIVTCDCSQMACLRWASAVLKIFFIFLGEIVLTVFILQTSRRNLTDREKFLHLHCLTSHFFHL